MLNKIVKKFIGYEYDKNNYHFIYWIFFFKLSIKDQIGLLKDLNKNLCNIINAIGTGKIPPAKGQLRQWQLELLELLKTFDKICRKKDIQYWLDFGTLLGAVRHKGFIPWDDDIDVSIMKTELDKILPMLKEYYEKSDFIVRERAINCNNFQIRIRHKKYNLGIDIFPVYYYPQTNLTADTKQEIINKIINARRIFEKIYNVKYMDNNKIKRAQKSISDIHEKYIAPINCDFKQGEILIHGIEYPYLIKEYVINSELIFPLKEAEFEGYKFLVPNKSEEYLSSLWEKWKYMPSSISIHEHYKENYKEVEK